MRRLTGGDEELIRLFSLEERDLTQTPPVFLWNTREDEKVSSMNSLLFAQRLFQAGWTVNIICSTEGFTG